MKSNRPLPSSNRHPADLLAELRQQIATLKAAEAELRAAPIR
ncbi:hypothetical protein ACE10Z_19825 [Bradyrhizobium sp. Pha-3]